MIENFIHRLPKTETHLHLEGALPYELLQKLNPKKYAQPPESWEDGFRFRDFGHFESELLAMACDWHTSPERYGESAKIIFERQMEQNVRYSEVSFASGVVEFLGVPGDEIAAAVRAAVPEGLEARIFMGVHHNGWTEKSAPFLEKCLSWEHLDGIDLHGDERLPLESWTAPFFSDARAAGKLIKAHAGELCGPAFVRRAVEELRLERVEHGVRAAECPATMALLRDIHVTLDVCPISNVKLGVSPSIREHQLRALFDAGVRCTVSSDDPLSFGASLTDNWRALAEEGGFNIPELLRIARYGFEAAHVSADVKRSWLLEFDNFALEALDALEESEAEKPSAE